MEEEDNIIVKWVQEDVETSYNLLNNKVNILGTTFSRKLSTERHDYRMALYVACKSSGEI